MYSRTMGLYVFANVQSRQRCLSRRVVFYNFHTACSNKMLKVPTIVRVGTLIQYSCVKTILTRPVPTIVRIRTLIQYSLSNVLFYVYELLSCVAAALFLLFTIWTVCGCCSNFFLIVLSICLARNDMSLNRSIRLDVFMLQRTFDVIPFSFLTHVETIDTSIDHNRPFVRLRGGGRVGCGRLRVFGRRYCLDVGREAPPARCAGTLRRGAMPSVV